MPFPASVKAIAALRKGPIARGALSIIAIRVTAIGLWFLQAVLMARLLGPGGYGVVAVALSVVAIAATVTMLGLGQLAVREVAQLSAREDWGGLRGFLRFSTLTVFAFSTLAAIGIAVLAAATELFDPAFRTEIMLATLLVPLVAMLLVLRGGCQGFGRIVAAQAPGELLQPGILVGALGLLLLTATALTTTDYIAIAIAAALAATITAAASLRRIVTMIVPASRSRMAPRDWGRAAAPFLGITVFGIVGTEANTLILGGMAGPVEAGLFQPIARIALIMMIATEAVSMPLAPRLAEMWERRDLQGIRRLFRHSTVVAVGGTVAVSIALLVLAPYILGAFGRDFLVNEHLLVWIALAQILNAACGAAGLLLAMAGKMKLRILAQGVTMAVQICFGLVLIGPYGAEGATAALVAAILVWSLANWFFARRALGVETSLLGLLRR